MKKKDGQVYFNLLWDQMLTHFKAFLETEQQEELHFFRVQVKKLRAMMELLDAGNSKKKFKRDFKPIRKIFRHCGNIRGAYINLQFGVLYQYKNEEFLMARLQEIKTGTCQVKEMGKQYLKTIKAVYENIEADLKSVDDEAILEFYRSGIDRIGAVIADLKFNDELHSVRKQIKILMYNRKMAQRALDGKLNIDTDYLNKLQDLIGDWHDNTLALELFCSPEVNYLPIVTKIKRQEIRLKRSITALVHDFNKKIILSGAAIKQAD
jgi:CHAD domain-containing protein